MNVQDVRNAFLYPAREELSNYIQYFHELINANPDRFPYTMLSTESLDDIIQKAIIMYIRLSPIFDKTGVQWGIDGLNLYNTGDWRKLDLKNPVATEKIMRNIDMLALDELGLGNAGRIYNWVLLNRRDLIEHKTRGRKKQ